MRAKEPSYFGIGNRNYWSELKQFQIQFNPDRPEQCYLKDI